MHVRRSLLVASAVGAVLGVAVSRRRALASAWTTPRGPVGRVGSRVIPMGTGSVYPEVARLLNLHSDDALLEVACGSGVFLAAHATHVRHVAGIDVSDIQVDLARRRLADRIAAGTARIVKGDAGALPWEDERFSAVVCISSMECFPEPEKALGEMYRVLRPGGRAVITIGSRVAGTVTSDRDVLGLWVWHEDDALLMAEQAGFADVSISYCRWGDTGPLFSAAYGLLTRLGLVDAEARVVRGVKQPR